MFSVMSGQLIGTGEFPAAAFPAAKIRFFARVSPQVGLQVTGFGVGFQTTFVGTSVNGDLFLAPAPSTPLFEGYSRWGRALGSGGGHHRRGGGGRRVPTRRRVEQID